MPQKKPKDPPLGFNKEDFKGFRPKRPRAWPILDTERRNRLNFDDDPYNGSSGRSIDVHFIDEDVIRARQEASDRKNAAIIMEMLRFWFVFPYEIIKYIFNRDSGPGFFHVVSIIFWISISYHAINFYLNPNDLLALAWIGLIIFMSAVVVIFKLILQDRKR